ncbi:PAS domain-containing protein [Flavobacterium quisquiliarum]|uniref:PAS domain-containing protein n=1 Tax=Flavobacterium quisquiliarum TaxID=1834436 RepID=A0ABV8WEH6_9FLAO|nr:PAS domain-containing protein [Flavobacterium quisquiliarum]MBW1657915.1 PAS domain-containing protein [Flavobacterium quisquiliarum]NWL00973.1 histidine kinase [Flavobacterium collinsii]
MKDTNSDDLLQRNTVPILSWDFHYEYVKELKDLTADLEKVDQISTQFTWDEKKLNIKERIKEEVVVVTDLDLKIVFVSSGIKKMTGYKAEEILGKTPKMFQGPATSKKTLKEIREALAKKIPFEKTLDNYRKNGKTYKCKIDASPVYNLKGEVSHFIAFEKQDLSA